MLDTHPCTVKAAACEYTSGHWICAPGLLLPRWRLATWVYQAIQWSLNSKLHWPEEDWELSIDVSMKNPSPCPHLQNQIPLIPRFICENAERGLVSLVCQSAKASHASKSRCIYVNRWLGFDLSQKQLGLRWARSVPSTSMSKIAKFLNCVDSTPCRYSAAARFLKLILPSAGSLPPSWILPRPTSPATTEMQRLGSHPICEVVQVVLAHVRLGNNSRSSIMTHMPKSARVHGGAWYSSLYNPLTLLWDSYPGICLSTNLAFATKNNAALIMAAPPDKSAHDHPAANDPRY